MVPSNEGGILEHKRLTLKKWPFFWRTNGVKTENTTKIECFW